MPHYFENNPPRLDSAEEVREAVREAGGNPMDVGTQEQATFGWSLLNSFEDDPPASRSDPAVFAAEAELVANELEHEYDVDTEDWPAVPDAPPWYDAP